MPQTQTQRSHHSQERSLQMKILMQFSYNVGKKSKAQEQYSDSSIANSSENAASSSSPQIAQEMHSQKNSLSRE